MIVAVMDGFCFSASMPNNTFAEFFSLDGCMVVFDRIVALFNQSMNDTYVKTHDPMIMN